MLRPRQIVATSFAVPRWNPLAVSLEHEGGWQGHDEEGEPEWDCDACMSVFVVTDPTRLGEPEDS